jgi:predicted DNA-binding transcriptional regulator AlpA
MSEHELSDLIGLAEVSEMYGLTKSGASNLVRGYDFPRPVLKLKMGPIWSRREVSEACRGREPAMKCAWCESSDLEMLRNDECLERDLNCRECGESTLITISNFPDPKYITNRTKKETSR